MFLGKYLKIEIIFLHIDSYKKMIMIGPLPIVLLSNHYRIKRDGDDFSKWVPRALEEHLSEYPDLCFSVSGNSVVGSVLTSYSYLAFEIKLYWADEDIILEARKISGESKEFGVLYQSIIGIFSGVRSPNDFEPEYTEEGIREEIRETISMILYHDPQVSLNGILNAGSIVKNRAITSILFDTQLLTILMNIVLRPEVSSYDNRIKEHAIYSLAYVAHTYTEEWETYLKKDENEFLSKLVDLVSDTSPHISKFASEINSLKTI